MDEYCAVSYRVASYCMLQIRIQESPLTWPYLTSPHLTSPLSYVPAGLQIGLQAPGRGGRAVPKGRDTLRARPQQERILQHLLPYAVVGTIPKGQGWATLFPRGGKREGVARGRYRSLTGAASQGDRWMQASSSSSPGVRVGEDRCPSSTYTYIHVHTYMHTETDRRSAERRSGLDLRRAPRAAACPMPVSCTAWENCYAAQPVTYGSAWRRDVLTARKRSGGSSGPQKRPPKESVLHGWCVQCTTVRVQDGGDVTRSGGYFLWDLMSAASPGMSGRGIRFVPLKGPRKNCIR